MVKKVYESRKITLPEALEYLRQRIESGGEDANYYQRIALEHAESFSKTNAKRARAIVEMLIEDYRLSETAAISVANVLPDTIDELRAVIGSEARTINTDTLYEMLNKISDILVDENLEDESED